MFKLARQWGGISFLKIADACEIKPERVGRLARGQGSVTTYEKIAKIADGLRIPGHLLGLAPRPWEKASGAVVPVFSPEGVPPPVATRYHVSRIGDPGATDQGDEVQRRDFLATTIGVTGGALMPPEVARGRRIGEQDVRQLQRRTARLRALDDVLGGADTRRLYRSEVTTTLHLVRTCSYTEPVGRKLLGVLAEQAQQAGWAAFDAGRQAEASTLYRRAHRAATEAGDRALAGNSLAFLAYQQVSSDASGVATAAASCEAAGRDAPSSVRALLHERRAWAHAKAGQPKETEQALSDAEEALGERNGESPVPHWSSWVDDRELQIMKGRCWTELRRPLRAVPVLEEALSGFDDTHARDKALYLTWLAHAYLDAGEIEHSAVVVGTALDLAAGVGSVRPRQRARELLTRLSPHRSLTPVADLLERVTV
ncbi:XRE family transcriptional regulator [Streptomyces sp. MNU89]|uniref:XRE family transcriptional regulator n=1 Tax=Streptomyces sp. MNU89 TaxID=2560025 RepID=UPI001E548E83|nr:XRE family transcriptional regulator [Streptomyces sp. MNU89]MCC9741514.1 XRE family transcriptional regulator [Streptomyces sp. MNU89]